MINEVIVIGNYHPSNHEASRVVLGGGISPTIKENHGTVTGVLVGNKEMQSRLEQFYEKGGRNAEVTHKKNHT